MDNPLTISCNAARIGSRKRTRNYTIHHFTLDPAADIALVAARTRLARIGGRAVSASIIVRRALEVLMARLDAAESPEEEAAEVAALMKHVH
ncbi:hypothetical protein FRZ44_33480 [Hypericibacter terrae]|uniref:Uncharacterized protein n=1 Tax=Hypericibacter terrae TaxID=2602015 RepID=A0A5J6MI58_9PROT|nr:hypothetical protein [Hypericibacter terrae]QEX16847.1 hypothetical protein FRZ44_21420 [Hypericibacter terrae]QEX18044.1 hypothetical protein FRZ44_33480 [Hypericibacter terrae]